MTSVKNHKRLFSSVVAVFMLAVQFVAPVSVGATNNHPPQNPPKVVICHGTASYSNPYTRNEVAQSSVDGNAGNDNGQGDHYLEHQGPVFYPSIPKHTEWGDIIPPIPGVHAGLNWTTEGQVIYNNRCSLPPKGSVEVNKKVDTDGDGIYEGGNTTANSLGFKWGLDNETPARSMGTTADDVATGDHTVTEKQVNGYVFTGWYYTGEQHKSCANPRGTTLPVTVTVEKDKTKDVTFCNKVVRGSITIIKDAQPNSSQDFAFHIDKQQSQWADWFTLDDDGNNSNTHSNTKTYNGVLGTYVVTEADVQGWKLSDLTCEGGKTVVDKANRKVTITVKPAENVTCTFVNQKQAKLKIVKEAWPNSSQDFSFTSPELGNFMLDDDNNPTLSNFKQFSQLKPGTYSVTEQATDGWKLFSVTCNDPSYTKDLSTGKLQVTLQAGDDITCTFVNKELNTISGKKFEDLNHNGQWNKNEPFLAGWTITLTKEGDPSFNKSVQTDAQGKYQFEDLTPGKYLVCEVQQAGWVQTFPQSNNGCHKITFYWYGENADHRSFGNYELGVITGVKFNDANGNGVRDNNEPTIKDWTINLYEQTNNAQMFSSLTTPTATTTTDSQGKYRFEDLQPGKYRVCEVMRANWTRTYPAASDCYDIEITTSGQVVTADFGNKFTPQVLGANTPTPQVLSAVVTPAQLVNTGVSLGSYMVVGLTILGAAGAAHFLTRRRKDYAQ